MQLPIKNYNFSFFQLKKTAASMQSFIKIQLFQIHEKQNCVNIDIVLIT